VIERFIEFSGGLGAVAGSCNTFIQVGVQTAACFEGDNRVFFTADEFFLTPTQS